MYFDVHTQPDWWRRAFVLRAALDELDFPNRLVIKSWGKRSAVLAATAVIILVLLALALPAQAGAGKVRKWPCLSGALWVTYAALNFVTAIDAATGDLIVTVKVGSYPVGITAPKDSGKVNVANQGK